MEHLKVSDNLKIGDKIIILNIEGTSLIYGQSCTIIEPYHRRIGLIRIKEFPDLTLFISRFSDIKVVRKYKLEKINKYVIKK